MKLIQIAHSWPLRLFTSYSTEYSLLYHRFGYFLDEILAFDRVDHFVPLAIGHLLELKWHLRGWVILYHRLGYLMDFVWHLRGYVFLYKGLGFPGQNGAGWYIGRTVYWLVRLFKTVFCMSTCFQITVWDWNVAVYRFQRYLFNS